MHVRSLTRSLPRVASIVLASALFCVAASAAPPIEQLRLPPGFRVELLTDTVPNARQMALGRHDAAQGIVYVGSAGAGKVYAVQYGAAGKSAAVHTVASGLSVPTGVAYRDGALFVGALTRVLRFDGIDDKLAAPPAPAVISDRFPTETHHGRRFIAFGPDGKLYVSVGAPCNICLPDDRHGVIQRIGVDGGAIETVARGVRNSVGFDWNPADRTLWFTDNGRDLLGDDLPADELDHVTRTGEHFGYPYCHQGDSPDPEFGAQRACSEFTAPAVKLGAHVAALGMRFYSGTQFPAAYRGNIFIAEHGSWNRSRKVGYQVVRVAVDGQGHAAPPEPFLHGFLQVQGGRESVWGRPADVLPLPDGSLLVSDDTAGAIYRVRYGPDR
ncbi:MAG TPA: PQQ-dependent sugar dehydrogenase [Caldimonas sp.]|nr:PQQ-dependent sugar dehydrogenase [Caldimonas sp.]HEX4236319.1 PQQ-dependent sugar dehydrogenase [Caldimonas sp.]